MPEIEQFLPDERHHAWVKAVSSLIQDRIQPTTEMIIVRLKEDNSLDKDFVILNAEEVAERSSKKRGRPKKEKKKIISIFDIESWKKNPIVLKWYQRNLQTSLWGQNDFEVKTFLRGALFRAIEEGDTHALTYVMKNAGVSLFEDEGMGEEVFFRKLWDLGMSGNVSALLKCAEIKGWISSEDQEMKEQFESLVTELVETNKGKDTDILGSLVRKDALDGGTN